jgi:hypothetical protein
MRCVAIKAFIASKSAREPTVMPETLALRPIKVTAGMSPPKPDKPPISATCPPLPTAANDCASIPAPPTSRIWCAPIPPVSSRIAAPHSGRLR